nr:beta-ketoacyl-[acyl-carrier-protein] synthase II [Candidatus Saccharibacteria bacterium]NIW78318.1 beta-ketoacyl-[acyl-carrier-protein] synthase II [Calditrichia bacterium]
MQRRVVITGMGSVTPIGNTVKDFWEGLLEGRNGIDHITHFDASNHTTTFGGEVKDFNVDGIIEPRDTRRFDLYTQYAIVAAHEAIKDSELDFDKTD